MTETTLTFRRPFRSGRRPAAPIQMFVVNADELAAAFEADHCGA